MDSMSPWTGTAVEILGLLSFGLTYRYIFTHPTPINQGYGGHSQLLTIWGLTLSTLALILGFVDGLSFSLSLLQGFRIYISLLALGMEFMITTFYWGISWYNPSLIRPAERWPSLSLDISLHLSPFLFVAVDILLAARPWIRPSYIALFGLSCLVLFSYSVWIEHCRTQNGWYPYPALEKIKGQKRRLVSVAFAAVMAFVGFLFPLVQMA